MQNGEYDALEGINKWIWFYYMATVFPNQSVIMNLNYYSGLAVSQFLSSYWFKVTSANTFFWLILLRCYQRLPTRNSWSSWLAITKR